jgi:hypothetical protein
MTRADFVSEHKRGVVRGFSRQPRDPEWPELESPLVFPCAVAPFPRAGRSLVPQLLQPFLVQPIEAAFADDSPGYLHWADLDASVWRVASESACRRLVARLADRLLACEDVWLPEIGDCQVMPRGWQSEERPLVLSKRTYDALVAARSGGVHVETATVGQIVGCAALDSASLLDLLTAVESWGLDYDWLTKQDAAGLASELLQFLNGLDVPPAAGRLLPLLNSMHAYLSPLLRNSTLAVTLQAVAQAPELILVPDGFRFAVSSLERAIGERMNGTLEAELAEWVETAVSSPRDARVLLAREGWGGSEPRTLESVSASEGLTRERVRQITTKAINTLKETRPTVFMPSLERAFDLLSQMAPCTREAAESRLVELGLAGDRFSVPGLTRAASALGKEMSVQLVRVRGVEWLSSPNDAQVPQQLVLALQEARRACGGAGALTVHCLSETITQKHGELVPEDILREFFDGHPEVVWLDAERSWFSVRLTSGRNRLENLIHKCLSVCGSLQISELWEATARNRRLLTEPPPLPVLACFCSRVCDLRVEGGLVSSKTGPDWRGTLSGDELIVVELLFELGPACHVDTLWPEAQSRGISRISFWVTLANSPVLVRYGRGIYGLRGIDLPTTLLANLLCRRTNVDEVLRTYSQLSDGRAYAVYRISSTVMRIAAVTWPASLREEFGGDFLLSSIHSTVAVNLAVQVGQQVTGLREGLSTAKVGQYLVIGLDNDERKGFLLLGDAELESLDDEQAEALFQSILADHPEQPSAPRISEPVAPEPRLRLSTLEEEIVSLLARNPRGLRAKEIASVLSVRSGVSLDRHEVNRALYGALRDRVSKIDDYAWVPVPQGESEDQAL